MKEQREENLIGQGYVLDSSGLRAFERHYTLPSLVGVIIFIFIFVLIWKQTLSIEVGIGLLAVAWLATSGVIAHMYFSKPKSKKTGNSLQKFKNSSPDCDGFEVLYVDPDTKTYFKRLFADGNIDSV